MSAGRCWLHFNAVNIAMTSNHPKNSLKYKRSVASACAILIKKPCCVSPNGDTIGAKGALEVIVIARRIHEGNEESVT
jgi:hypothetical protein